MSIHPCIPSDEGLAQLAAQIVLETDQSLVCDSLSAPAAPKDRCYVENVLPNQLGAHVRHHFAAGQAGRVLEKAGTTMDSLSLE